MLKIVLVKEAAEGDEENWVREEAGDGDAEVSLEMLDGSEDGLPDVGPGIGDGSAIQADELFVSDTTHKVGGEALENGHRGDGLEPRVLEAGLVVVTEEFFVLLLKVEAALGVISLGDDDLEDGEGLPPRIDPGEDLARDIDAVIRDLDDGEVVTGQSLAVGLDAFALFLRIAVEVGDVLGQEVVDGECGARVLGYFGVDALLVYVGLRVDVDTDVFVVDDFAIPGDAEAVADGVEAGDSLLPVQNILHGVTSGGLGKLNVADIPEGGQLLAGLPDDEGTQGEAFDDAVDELRGLLLVPDEVALESGQLQPALVDVSDQIIVFAGNVLWEWHGQR